MKRDEFSKRTKADAFMAADGRCVSCGRRLKGPEAEYDHAIPAAFGGTNDLSNCRCLCVDCHQRKTSEKDIPAIAKSNRIRAKQAGLKKKTKFRGWRKMNGDLVFAND